MAITVLIADDKKFILESWKYVLNLDSRFQVIAICTSGEKAIEQAQKLLPDIVIMDNSMPGISGFEATAIIRKCVPKTKVLGFSLYKEPDYARKFIAEGAAGYIEKTASIKKIEDTLLSIYYNKPLAILN